MPVYQPGTERQDAGGFLHPAKAAYAGWEVDLAGLPIFYVRRYTWFRLHFLRNATALSPYGDRVMSLQDATLSGLEKFPNLKWTEPYSWRQATYAFSERVRKPLAFHKAVQTILLCKAAAIEMYENGDVETHPDEVVKEMAIHCAGAYIRDLTKEQFQAFEAAEPNLIDELIDYTGQPDSEVFREMCIDMERPPLENQRPAPQRYTVTWQLAERVREFLVGKFPEERIGLVTTRLIPRFGAVASDKEVINNS